MTWIEIVLPAAIAAFTSFLIAVLTIRHQSNSDVRELHAKVQSELNEWKMKFAELSAENIEHARAAAQQQSVGILILRSPNSEINSTAGGDGYSSEKFFVPKHARITIGRNEGSFIQIDDGSVSRTHAVIESTDDEVVLRDVSTHGTFINGSKEGVEKYILEDGDKIRIGNASIAFVKL